LVLSTGDISSMIFKRLLRSDLGDFSLDRQTLVVLMELDGKTTLGELARKSGLTIGTMREPISNLLRLGLIERVEKDIVPMDNDCFRYMLDQLAMAIGPIAGVLIEDEVKSFGHKVVNFPSYLVTNLVNKLAGEIRREDKKSVFIKNMVNKIREKGYSNS
jgi:predicted transcriptional regulator